MPEWEIIPAARFQHLMEILEPEGLLLKQQINHQPLFYNNMLNYHIQLQCLEVHMLLAMVCSSEYGPCFSSSLSALLLSLSLRAWGEQEPSVPPASVQSNRSAGNRCRAGMLCLRISDSEHPVEERRGAYSELVCLINHLVECVYLTHCPNPQYVLGG